jgi:hypothetical protein
MNAVGTTGDHDEDNEKKNDLLLLFVVLSNHSNVVVESKANESSFASFVAVTIPLLLLLFDCRYEINC